MNEAIQNWLVEIYTVLRIVKMPVGGILSGLGLCYHGAVHTLNIVNIFLQTNLYTISLKHEVLDFLKASERCIVDFGNVITTLPVLTKNRCDYLERNITKYALQTIDGIYRVVIDC